MFGYKVAGALLHHPSINIKCYCVTVDCVPVSKSDASPKHKIVHGKAIDLTFDAREPY